MPNKKHIKPTHDQCRPPLERMFHIHAELQNGTHPDCSSLACEFELSPRALARDIASAILSFGPHAVVVGPQALVDRLARTAEVLRARYGKADAHSTEPGLDICAGCFGRAKGT